MKKQIEVVVEVPDCIDDELMELLLYLSDDEVNLLKGIVTGMLISGGRVSFDQLNAIHTKYKK